ncbi:MAG: DUF4399 domain-containing protein [Cytophagales bacterium]|nr:DUF4399 domain-containing protein [Cytophagales bacterium]
MKKILFYIIIIVVTSACTSKTTNETAAETEKVPETAESKVAPEVFFILPKNGDTVSSPVKITMGVRGMEVEPAGQINEGKGHHHLIINGSYIEKGKVVPADSTHIHYGKGQTEVELELAPGNHTITMQFADGVHVSYGESMSRTIEIVVAE